MHKESKCQAVRIKKSVVEASVIMLRWQKRKMKEPLWKKPAAAFVLEMISMPKKLENGTRNPSVNLLKRLADWYDG